MRAHLSYSSALHCRLALALVSARPNIFEVPSPSMTATLPMPALPAACRPRAAEKDPPLQAALAVGPHAPVGPIYDELDLSWEVRLHACARCLRIDEAGGIRGRMPASACDHCQYHALDRLPDTNACSVPYSVRTWMTLMESLTWMPCWAPRPTCTWPPQKTRASPSIKPSLSRSSIMHVPRLTAVLLGHPARSGHCTCGLGDRHLYFDVFEVDNACSCTSSLTPCS